VSLEFYTIGVYGSTEKSFFDKLVANQIDTFCDIRNRRGVRGSKYGYVNSKKLQQKLQEINIKYLHILDLSPSKEIRALQKQADKESGVLKSERTQLGSVFRAEYSSRVLNKFDFNKFIDLLKQNNSRKIVLFCVEQEATACHRSIVAEKIATDLKLPIKHL